MNDTLLITAGLLGASVAIVHGVLMQKFMIKPLLQSSYGQGMSMQIKRLMPVLLHFSTLLWLIGGVFLVLAALVFDQRDRLIVSVIVGGFYLMGAIGNLWGTRGRHPGWIMLAITVLLIVSSYQLN